MRDRSLRIVTVGAAGILLGGCGWWGTIGYPCEEMHNCPWVEAGSDAGSMHNDADASLPGDVQQAVTDGGDGSEMGVADVGADRGDVAIPLEADTRGVDGDLGEGGAGCSGGKAPSDEPCAIAEQYGVFVAPSATAAPPDGTRVHPFTSLADALQRAKTDHKHVYACDDGTGYSVPLSVGPSADGVKVFGGFECSGWTYDKARRAKLTTSTSPALAITALSAGITLEDFEIVAKDAASPGQSSIGIVVKESVGVVLRRVRVTAGNGYNGTDGENGGPSNDPTLVGTKGAPGADACSAKPNPGGAAAETLCNGIPCGTSGRGGDGALNTTAAGGDGTPMSTTSGQGGIGEPQSGSWSCDKGGGHNGDNGLDGPAGASGTGLGSLTAAGWKGNDGADGSRGQPGQGGGGGGGAKAPNACTAADGGALSPTGASGGGGGSGGCGGNGGRGGTAGGSSITLVSLGSDVALESCELIASDAGKGGNGGQGQGGGIGGVGGTGGVGSGNPLSKAACDGGKGGQGGNGGAGGGGMGGHSIGVAYRGKAPTGVELASAKIGAKGTGGKPGSGTGNGDDGVAAVLQSFDTADAGD